MQKGRFEVTFDYFDPKCPKCGKKLEYSSNYKGSAGFQAEAYYNIFSCDKCHSNFRASAPGGEVSMLTDKCAKCEKKPIQYSRSISVGPVSYDVFHCKKCGTYTQSDSFGNVWAIELKS
jgi:hypothetical protein